MFQSELNTDVNILKRTKQEYTTKFKTTLTSS